MQHIETSIDSDGGAWLTVSETRTPSETLWRVARDFAGEWYCNHENDRAGERCILAPPTWTYLITGGHHRWSLGGLLWHLAQRIERPHGTEVYRHPVTREQLVEVFGWSGDLLDPADDDQAELD